MIEIMKSIIANLLSGYTPKVFNLLPVSLLSPFISLVAMIMIYVIYILYYSDAVKDVKFQKTLNKLEKKRFGSIEKILEEYVNREGGLDFAACIHNGHTHYKYSKNQLNYRLELFRIEMTSEEHVGHCNNIIKEIESIIDIANEHLKELGQNNLFKVVFDLQQGGCFYYRFADSGYVVGITTDQSSMNDYSADKELYSMIKSIKNYLKE